MPVSEPFTSTPRFTVVIPAYNAGSTLSATLDSVAAQSFADYEVVVVDDGSTDDTAQVAERFAAADSRVRVLRKVNGGTASAYNAGVAAARAEWITILSADDTLEPIHLSAIDQAIGEQPAFDIFHTNGVFVYPDRHYVGYRDAAHQTGHEVTFESLVRRCIYGVGATYRRAAFERVGGYRPDVYIEDWDFWLRLVASGSRIWYVPVVSWNLSRTGAEKSGNLNRVIESGIEILARLAASGDYGPAVTDAITAETARNRERLDRIARGLPADPPRMASPKPGVTPIRRLVRRVRRALRADAAPKRDSDQ